MAIENILDEFGDTDPYKFKKIGSFGRFSTVNNFPIEFFLTTLSANELDSLTFARHIKPQSIDFEHLMQRDIDEERVKTEIEPYITSPTLSDREKKAKTIFFPPLLIATVPVKNKVMMPYYANQEIQDTDGMKVVREWSGNFKLVLKKDKDGYTIRPEMDSDKEYKVMREPAVFEAKISNGKENGVCLVVIDGQHRLKALQDIYREGIADFKELAVPICILFSPDSTEKVSSYFLSDEITIPTIPQIFRQLFVDVNKNAEQVGGHFNILLTEGNIGSSICRLLCKYVFESRGLEGLAQIEWNQKKKKLSTEINKSYQITSIGVIEKALSESFSKSKNVLNYIIEFDSVKNEVNPTGYEDDFDFPKISWDKFSLSQKTHLEKKLSETIVPLLDKIFFDSEIFSSLKKIFNEELDKVRKLKDIERGWELNYQAVLDNVLEYIPIDKDRSSRPALNNLRKFEDDIFNRKEDEVFYLSNFAIFQRGLILALHDFMKQCFMSRLDVTIAKSFFNSYLDTISGYLKKMILPRSSYCQSYIFNYNKVNPTSDVKKGISCLILSLLSRDEIRRSIFSPHSSEIKDFDEFSKDMRDLGYKSISQYFELFRKSKERDFKSSYITDGSISPEERETLQQLEVIKKKDEKMFRDGVIPKSEISNEFDIKISGFVERQVNIAKQELISVLDIKIDIFDLTPNFNLDYDLED